VPNLVIDGRNPQLRAAAWAAADVFISLSDNIQESFGLAPVEAMAAGLPCVVSDWDGYRDTVADGQTGFFIPTAMPGPGAGADFAFRYLAEIDTYDLYIGHVSQCTAVDVPATIEACVRLIENPALRKSFGAAGRARARQLFDWGVVVKQYQALLAELAARRAKATPSPHAPGHPLRADPFEVFRAFPTLTIGDETLVELVTNQPMEAVGLAASVLMTNYALEFMLSQAEFDKVLAALPPGQVVEVRQLAGLLPPGRRHALLRGLGWLAKVGVVRLSADRS
jgi:hypothetical protein